VVDDSTIQIAYDLIAIRHAGWVHILLDRCAVLIRHLNELVVGNLDSLNAHLSCQVETIAQLNHGAHEGLLNVRRGSQAH
jgi:hypothetical protein